MAGALFSLFQDDDLQKYFFLFIILRLNKKKDINYIVQPKKKIILGKRNWQIAAEMLCYFSMMYYIQYIM